MALLWVLVHSVVASADGRTDYLIRMLTTASLFRVRVQAALTLGEIGDVAAVPALTDALGDEEPTVRSAALAALARLGDPSALDAARERTRDRNPAVKRQARLTVRALEVALRARSAPSASREVATSPAARWYIGFGGMGNRAGVRGDELRGLLRRYLIEEVQGSSGVVLTPDDETPTQTAKVLKQKRLAGFWVDGSVTKLQRDDAGVRAEVSLMVMTNPGRDLRMMLSGSATVTAAGRIDRAAESALQDRALRGAASGAVHRLLTQLETQVENP